ncbi:MAG TPA: hypothetical protein VN429_11575 [Methanospirillum sp.]|uniref:hypothetical protein n=1 Tax=Methanospirillum sp. TaxID=45200 RepID=UPI002C528534|nr:hypothetical protein [Methanospirillum sp.]HWQ65049.1 hypothetical protein [Methanospirillum sp.]
MSSVRSCNYIWYGKPVTGKKEGRRYQSPVGVIPSAMISVTCGSTAKNVVLHVCCRVECRDDAERNTGVNHISGGVVPCMGRYAIGLDLTSAIGSS